MPTKSTLLQRLALAEAEIARLRARDTIPVRSVDTATDAIRSACGAEQEAFAVLLLDSRQRILAVRMVALGSLADVSVHPREVFRDAVRMAAHSIVVGHNHPSGDPSPSDEDIALTTRLVDAGQLLGIPVLDHIIVTRSDAVSLAQRGIIG